MEHQSFKESKGRNLSVTLKENIKNRIKYYKKLLVPTCTVIHTILSKKHTSVLTV